MKGRPADSHGDWVFWSTDGRTQILIQPELAGQLVKERLLRRDAEDLAEQEERRQKKLESENLAAVHANELSQKKPGAVGPHQPQLYEVHRYQVLLLEYLLVERLNSLKAGLYGEKDHTAREVAALSAALARGTDRSIVRRPQWREDLEDLANELPAFRVAVEIVLRAHAVAELSGEPASIPPILIVGAPGVGKSYFCRRLADTLGAGTRWLAMDQPSAGSELRGSDKHWSTARHGILFDLLGLGRTANPVIVLDEIDKVARRQNSQEIDPLSQLYSLLEKETARRVFEISLDIELDASQVVYIATANTLRTLDAALLSRFEVVHVGLPSPTERRESAWRIINRTMQRLGVGADMRVSPGIVVLVENYSPRIVQRTVEKAVGAAVAGGRLHLGVDDIEAALGLIEQKHTARMH